MVDSTDAFLATHVNLKHVNRIEARYKVLSLNVKFSELLLLTLYTGNLSYIASILFANVNFSHVTHVKITSHWKSTLIRGRLSNGVFERRASTGNKPLYLKICHNASKVELLSSVAS